MVKLSFWMANDKRAKLGFFTWADNFRSSCDSSNRDLYWKTFFFSLPFFFALLHCFPLLFFLLISCGFMWSSTQVIDSVINAPLLVYPTFPGSNFFHRLFCLFRKKFNGPNKNWKVPRHFFCIRLCVVEEMGRKGLPPHPQVLSFFL